MYRITFPAYWSALDCAIILRRYGITDYCWAPSFANAVLTPQPVPAIPSPRHHHRLSL